MSVLGFSQMFTGGGSAKYDGVKKGNFASLSNNNLLLTCLSGNSGAIVNKAISSGKRYADFLLGGGGANYSIGVVNQNFVVASELNSGVYIGNTANGWGLVYGAIGLDGKYHSAAFNGAYGSAFASGDTLGIAVDADNGFFYVSLNGVWMNSSDPTSGATGTGAVYTIPTGISYFMAVDAYGTNSTIAFNQATPTYNPPSGYTKM